jgi:hypothetical protein
MASTIYNFFNFLEKKAGKTLSSDENTKLKLKHAKELLTDKEVAALSVEDKMMYFPEKLTKEDLADDVNLYKSEISSLPDNLTVGGDLILTLSNITSLPKNLKVGGHLKVNWSRLEKLPYDIQVGGNLILTGTPFIERNRDIDVQELRRKLPGVKGYVLV